MEIDLVPEGLDGSDDPGYERVPGQNLEITGQGAEGYPAEFPQLINEGMEGKRDCQAQELGRGPDPTPTKSLCSFCSNASHFC